MTAEPIRMMVVDGHPSFAEVLSVAVAGRTDLRLVGHAGTGEAAVPLADELRPDVVLIDVDLPDADGVTVTERVRAQHPGTRVVMVTGSGHPDLLRRAVAAGASGFLAKNGPLGDVLHAVQTAHAGGMTVSSHLLTGLLHSVEAERHAPAGGLTPREREVLRLMGSGLDTRRVARRLGISVHTCRGHTRSVLTKLEAHTPLEAVAVATRRGLIRAAE